METIFNDSCSQYEALFVQSKPIWDSTPIFGTGGIFKGRKSMLIFQRAANPAVLWMAPFFICRPVPVGGNRAILK